MSIKDWDSYVQYTVATLQNDLLLRRLHALQPTSQSTIAYINQTQLQQWLCELGDTPLTIQAPALSVWSNILHCTHSMCSLHSM